MRLAKLIPLVAVGLAAVLAYPLWRVAERTRSDRQVATCRANLAALASALEMYCQEHDGLLPPADRWSDAVLPYVSGGKSSFVCPAAQNQTCSYAMNKGAGGSRPSTVSNRNSFIVLFESDAGWNASGGPELLPSFPRHFGGYDSAVSGSLSGLVCVRDYQLAGSRRQWRKAFRGDRAWAPESSKAR
jgi:hypothetical protein